MNRAILSILTLAGCLAAGSLFAADDTNAPPATIDLKTFQIISQRNIFNPNRSAYRPPTAYPRVVRNDWFTLIGTLSYEKGRFAFFDGSSSEYRKTLKVADTIAGYKITGIEENSIELLASSNKTITLPVGDQMKRPDGGRWMLAGHAPTSDSSDSAPATAASPAAAGSPTPDAPSAPPSGAESDIMKRLMAKQLSEK